MGLRSEAMKSLTADESAVASSVVSGCQAVEGFAHEADSLTSVVSANAGSLSAAISARRVNTRTTRVRVSGTIIIRSGVERRFAAVAPDLFPPLISEEAKTRKIETVPRGRGFASTACGTVDTPSLHEWRHSEFWLVFSRPLRRGTCS